MPLSLSAVLFGYELHGQHALRALLTLRALLALRDVCAVRDPVSHRCLAHTATAK
jgi:hypothetical protein